MRRIGVILSGVVLASFSLALGQGADRGTATVTLKGKEVSVEYGRPALKGRDMLAQASDGMVWRMGANAATTLTTAVDLDFGGKKVPVGKYLLLAKKAGDKWHLIVNSNANASANNRDKALDVAEIPFTNGTNPESVETLTMTLQATGENGGKFTMAWGAMNCSAEFTVK